MEKKWIKITPGNLPEENMIIETKIDDERGERNICRLKRMKNLWWLPDGGMYVYYTPTHYRLILSV